MIGRGICKDMQSICKDPKARRSIFSQLFLFVYQPAFYFLLLCEYVVRVCVYVCVSVCLGVCIFMYSTDTS